MSMNSSSSGERRTKRALAACAALLAFCLVCPAAAREQAPVPGTATSEWSWLEIKRRVREYVPQKIEEYKERIDRFRLVTRPDTELDGYEENPALFIAITSFYDYIKGRELDMYEEQDGIPRFFPGRAEYYDFLDTILPPMRDRKFERNRLLEYAIHEIEPVEGEERVRVRMSIESDDIYPFGKIMVYDHYFVYGMRGWRPGKVEAKPATYWERIR